MLRLIFSVSISSSIVAWLCIKTDNSISHHKHFFSCYNFSIPFLLLCYFCTWNGWAWFPSISFRSWAPRFSWFPLSSPLSLRPLVSWGPWLSTIAWCTWLSIIPALSSLSRIPKGSRGSLESSIPWESLWSWISLGA